ncbi:MAG: VOC family protein [Nocardioidaceae bacterium]|nr:VOC family protein [Nocardioidaceae bacterium]
MSLVIQCLGIDCHDPMTLSAFWREALGWRVTYASDDQHVLEPAEDSPQDGVAADLLFLKVPENKTVKNRLHLDLRPDDQAAEVQRLLSLGAATVDIGQGEQSWVVMADPEGNEFCVLRALTAEELAE